MIVSTINIKDGGGGGGGRRGRARTREGGNRASEKREGHLFCQSKMKCQTEKFQHFVWFQQNGMPKPNPKTEPRTTPVCLVFFPVHSLVCAISNKYYFLLLRFIFLSSSKQGFPRIIQFLRCYLKDNCLTPPFIAACL